MSKSDIIIELPTPSGKGVIGYSVCWKHQPSPHGWLNYCRTTDTEKQLLTEIARLQAESEWQPFETAPTDGTWIEVWCEDGGAKFARCINGEWWAEDGYILNDLPTHWKPLPKGPGQT